MRAGIAFRPELAAWLATHPQEVSLLELSVGEALATARDAPARRGRHWPTALQARALSILTPGPPDPADIDPVLHGIRAVDPIWISVYLGCRHRAEAELAYPQPVSLSRATLGRAVANCRRLIDGGARPLLVENVTAFGIADGSLSPARFINQLCGETGCRLLLDVTALTLDARFGYDPRRWLWEVDPSHVAVIRLAGWAARGLGRWAGRREGQVSEATWLLAREVADRTPVGTAILQRDGRRSTIPELQEDLHRLASLDGVAAPALGRLEPAIAVR